MNRELLESVAWVLLRLITFFIVKKRPAGGFTKAKTE